ncbi:ExeM/NucH family extracellular endonuclease [Microbacterium sp. RU33B]|uniref:ExeM/NucH family extracellular endonuclease n=1 Tax=Microbacterium sp. RU33B TaxID=1907390 RepID=UPI000969D58F|nr:ExeM/NucH family extracellular endonuclease [Microbacterium sp. RU33B]SIT74060.1 Predicted extracellular nuclease [Microbacterium sp. RU33B]
MIPPSRRRRLAASAIAVGALVGSGLVAAAPAQAAVAPNAPLVISEVYGGGGNSGATIERDFIELTNSGPSAVALDGWSVQYASASGTSWAVTPLTGSIPAGGSYLVGQAAGSGGTLDLNVDASGSIAMSGTNGKVALVSATTPLSCGAACSTADPVVDFVGYGSANEGAGGTTTPVLSNSTSASRTANTASNAADFTVGAPNPRYTGGSAVVTPDPDPEPEPATDATIAQIQGSGTASPLLGANVKTRGVVTASYPTGGFQGYVIQTPGTGGAVDLSTHVTSDGLFVYSPGTPIPTVGAYVEVTGIVSEFGGTASSPSTLTQVTASAVTALTEPFVPPLPALVAWPTTDAQRESLESMLISPQNAFTVSNTFSANQFGEVGLAAGSTPLIQPTDVARPGTPEAAAVAADNAARRVALDDGASINFLSAANQSLVPTFVSLDEPIRVGASVSISTPMIVDWRNSTWKLQPTAPLVGAASAVDGVTFENTRTAAPAEVGGDISIASFNVLNYFTTIGADTPGCVPFRDRTGDPVTVDTGCSARGAWDPDDLARQQEKIVAAINTLDADVVGLMEIENSLVVDGVADEATATLVAALNAAAGETRWAYIPSSTDLPPAAEMDVITNAIIYQPAAVTPVGASRALGTESTDAGAFGNAREPLAQVFRPAAGGEKLLFVVNHFKSKGSPGPWPGDADTGDGQGASNESRIRQATALRDWVGSIQGGVDSVALAGDFNSYGAEDPLQVLYDAGYVNAETELDIDKASYSFSGLSGSLDHILLSGAAAERATGGDIWQINSGESLALEYSRYNYHGALFHEATPFRSSDHDPVKVGLEAGVDERAVAKTTLLALPPVHINRILPATLVAAVTAPRGTTVAGTVEFREGSTVIGTATVSRGVATLQLPRVISRGTHSYTATFVPTDPESVIGSTSKTVRVIAIL